MEGEMRQWKEEEAEAEVEEMGLIRRQAHEEVTTTTSTTTISITSSYIETQEQEISETEYVSSGIEKKNITSPSPGPIISEDLTSLYNVAFERQEISETEYISSFSEAEKNITSPPSSDPIISRVLTPQYNVTIESEKRQEIYETKDNPSSSDIEKKNITLPSSDPFISRTLTSSDNVTIESEKRQEIYETKENPSSSGIEKNIPLPSSDPVISRVLTSLDNVTTESERVGVITENIQLAKELYLESVFQKPPTKGFYCPNCRACIQKVLILDTAREDTERFRCTTCLSVLIPIGRWVFPWWVRDKEEITDDAPETRVPAPEQVPPVSRGQMLQPEPTITDGTRKPPEEEQVPDGSRTKPSRWGALASASAIARQKKPQVDISEIPEQQQQVEEVVVDEVRTDSSYQAIEIQEGELGSDGSRPKPSRWGVLASASAISMPKKPQVDISETPEQQKPVEEFAQAEPSTDQSYQAIEIPEDEQVPDESRAKTSRWRILASASAVATPRKPQVDISEVPEHQKPVEDVVHDGISTEPLGSTTSVPTTTARVVQEPGSSKAWDFLKSIVYGGLIESIASLGIVASSASADATTLSIVSLSLANLIGGLFVLVHHIWDLKSEQQTTNEHVDRYYLSLGNRDNFYLHVLIATLSFIIFGVVPPLVYGLTLYETNDKDLTLVAVAGASVICITLLSIAKTYIKRPNTYLTYLKTVLYYLCTGALTSVVAYLVGVLIRKLLEKVGFSSESSLDFNLMLPEMSMVEKPRFGSY